jgi:hypothetical protein
VVRALEVWDQRVVTIVGPTLAVIVRVVVIGAEVERGEVAGGAVRGNSPGPAVAGPMEAAGRLQHLVGGLIKRKITRSAVLTCVFARQVRA